MRSDGAILCPCEELVDIEDREPMTRELGIKPPHGHFWVRCANPVCDHHERSYYVSTRESVYPTDAKGPHIKVLPDRRVTNPIPTYDRRSRAVTFGLKQRIESYHASLPREFGLAHKDRSERRVVAGIDRIQFWTTFGDLLYNLDVEANLRAQGELGAEQSWDDLYRAYNRDERRFRDNQERGLQLEDVDPSNSALIQALADRKKAEAERKEADRRRARIAVTRRRAALRETVKRRAQRVA